MPAEGTPEFTKPPRQGASGTAPMPAKKDRTPDPIAQAVSAELARRGLSRLTFSTDIGLATPIVSRWLSGARREIRVDTRSLILEALGLELRVVRVRAKR